MVKFQSHLNELDNIKEAIEKYKTGNESQAYWAKEYGISLSIFRYYYNKKDVKDITRRKEKSTSDEHIVHEPKLKPLTRKGSKHDDFINGDPILKKAIRERYGHETIDVDSPKDGVSMKLVKEIKRASSLDTRHFEKLEPLENKKTTRKSNIDFLKYCDPDGRIKRK
ncbi:MAG: hypothetical protein Harvfovirus71_6 [Harvfovirus sp.]|uniref:Uncharacterized protein n=1 Tax=Harvfovirus sp. TaxID=2487768 RepID=A0A3G5A6K8_9VIRU|nr:MAG: hypothetical protein Harvfovirus71_6 [Harvfovirus sp.]